MNDLYKKFSITPTFFEDWIKKHDWDIIKGVNISLCQKVILKIIIF